MSNNHSETPDITVVITAHREGIIAGATARSAREAIEHVQQNLGKTVEILLVLDRADALTKSTLTGSFGPDVHVLETDEGDPGQARNRGVEAAKGEYICFLDADDFWSYNWLTEAYRLVEQRPDVVAHSHCNITFGREKNLWWHVDSEGALFDPAYLEWGNYWDAMAFARTEVYRRFRFRPNDLSLGFGHEDWHWNCQTIAAGFAHKPVPHTIHFKRRRDGSVSAKVKDKLGTVWPLEAEERDLGQQRKAKSLL